MVEAPMSTTKAEDLPEAKLGLLELLLRCWAGA